MIMYAVKAKKSIIVINKLFLIELIVILTNQEVQK